MRNGPRAVIFDMDGVLLDSYDAHWRSWLQSSSQRGIGITLSQYKALFGRSFRAFAEALSPRPLSDDEVRAWDDDKERQYREIIERDFPAMPGATELIHALHAAGFALGIASSGPRDNVDCLLRHLPGAERLQASVSANDTLHHKPHPEPFLACARALHVEPVRCIVIEDAVHGLRGARAAGMATVGLTGTCTAAELQPYADLVVAALRELSPGCMYELLADRAAGAAALRA